MLTVKKTLIFLILLIIAISWFEFRFKWAKESPLKGYFISTVEPPDLKRFTWKRWMKGEFQQEFQTRIENHIGFRKSLYRLRNQWDYSLFRVCNSEGFISGRDGCLFEEDYILEYNGDYFIGEEALNKKMLRLKNVYDSLKAHHIELILVFEPGKASVMPEYIPGRYHPLNRSLSNQTFIKQKAVALEMPFLDLNEYFLKMKDTSRYPLFHKYGMHWSIYGVALAADTLKNYIAGRTGKQLPEIGIEKIEWSDTARLSDNDIGKTLNLLLPLPQSGGAYPVLKIEDDSLKRNLSALVIADSYYLNFCDGISDKLFKNEEYWYYNHKLYPYQDYNPPAYVDKSDLISIYKKYNIILLMVSEINMHNGFWNFADEAFLGFHPEFKDDHIYTIENEIRNERSWFRFMAKKAKSQGRPLHEMIRNDAEYTFYNNYSNIQGKTRQDSIIYLVLSIYKNQEWLSAVEKKAKEQNVTLDTMIRRDAEYLYDQSKQNH